MLHFYYFFGAVQQPAAVAGSNKWVSFFDKHDRMNWYYETGQYHFISLSASYNSLYVINFCPKNYSYGSYAIHLQSNRFGHTNFVMSL